MLFTTLMFNMKKRRKIIMFLLTFLILCFISVHNFYRINDDQRKYREWLLEQQRRIRLVEENCQKYQNASSTMNFDILLENWQRNLYRLAVDDEHKLLYCFIPKVACTTWKRLMMILSSKTNIKLPDRIPHMIAHRRDSLVWLSDMRNKTRDVKMRLDSYRKLLIVRHPFERLISVYRDKIRYEKNTESSIRLRSEFGVKMMSNFKRKSFIPFGNFVNFLIKEHADKKHEFNPHWRQYMELCHPCQIKYDFIGNFSSLSEDGKFILQNIGASDNLNFPKRASKSHSFIDQYKSELSSHQIDSLYNIYKEDFTIFNFSKIY